MQIAKASGSEVSGVCSTPKTDLVRALGADHIVDYTREDFADGEHRARSRAAGSRDVGARTPDSNPRPGPAASPSGSTLDQPLNQRKLHAVEQLAQLADAAGIMLIQLAIAFVLNHPAITAAIIGPRTIEHLETQLAADDVRLTDDVLDRIGEIVPPGVTINPVDNSFANPVLEPSARRR